LGVIRNAFVVGAFTLFSRVIGFIRECVMAFCLGAGVHSDALLIAVRIANTFRRIFAEGAFNASFLPRFSRVINASPSERSEDSEKFPEGRAGANVVLSDVFSALVMFLVPAVIVILIIFPSFLQILVSGFDVLSEKFGLTVSLGRICFPYLFLITIASLFSGVLNAINRFALPAIIYSMLSACVTIGLSIGYFLDLSHYSMVHVVAWCVIVSGIVQSYILYMSIRRHGFKVNFNWNCWTPFVKDTMKNMIPGIIGAGVWQLNLLVDTTISSYLPTGTITCVNLADRLNQFPLGTVGIALSTALLPILSRLISQKEYDKAIIELERGLLFAFFLMFFASTVLTALDKPSVAVAFQRGLFQGEHVRITANVLVGLAVGLPAYAMTKVFSALYFSTGDTKSPVIFCICSVALNVLFLILLVPFLKYRGLSLCTSLSAMSNAGMLAYFAQKKMPFKFSDSFWYKMLSQAITAIVTYSFLQKMVDLFWYEELGASAVKWLVYIGFVAAAVMVYFSTAVICLRLTKQKQWKLWKKEAW